MCVCRILIKINYLLTHQEMKIPERDVTYIILSVLYLRLSIDIHWTGSSPIRHRVN